MFDEATLRFLRELKSHNDRTWFEANRERYQRHVAEPAFAFIGAIAPHLAEISPHLIASRRRLGGSLMRVHRDTRFSKDKTPYKTNIGIRFSHARARDVHAPGFYVHIEPGSHFLGAGIWHPDPKALAAIRREIVEQPTLWQRVRTDEGFIRTFELGGDRLAKPPRGFPADAPHIDDLKRKDFIAGCSLEEHDVLAPTFVATAVERFASARPLLEFLCAALDLPF
jgi:uncharacterized protein (TIGR02453 family)